MDRRFDPSELAEARIRNPIIPTVADTEPELIVAELSPQQTTDAMHDECVNARLELLYCPSVSAPVRLRLADRLGEIDLQDATAASEIEQLYRQLAVGKADGDDTLDLDVAEIHHRLWRLRELCLRHQEFVRSAVKQ